MKRILAVVLILGLCVRGYADTIAAFTNIANGDTSDAPTLMTNLNLLRDECNGNLNNDNIKALAGIIESKLNLNALALSNFVANADMELWAAGTSTVPDDWTNVSTATVARDTAEQGGGSYAAKITAAGSADEGMSQTITNLKISTVYRVSARVKVTSGDTASITTTGATTNMDEDSTSASWATVTGTFTTDGSGTDVVLQLLAQNDTDVVWFDRITVTEGTCRVGWTPRNNYIEADANFGQSIYLVEQSAADTDVAGMGQVWVALATANQLYFTDDAGTDFQLGSTASTVDIVQASNLGVATSDTTVLTFAFVPTEILISYNIRGRHDTSYENGSAAGQCLVTITGTDTFTSNLNSVTTFDNNGSFRTTNTQNDTTNVIEGGVGHDGTDYATVVGVGAWVTATKQLTITFTALNTDDAVSFVALTATAYR